MFKIICTSHEGQRYQLEKVGCGIPGILNRGGKPALLNDLIQHLRESLGCRIGKDWFQGDLRRAGAHFGSLQHGAGV
jgi:hypothetical protein